jgi:hypothetical protein
MGLWATSLLDFCMRLRRGTKPEDFCVHVSECEDCTRKIRVLTRRRRKTMCDKVRSIRVSSMPELEHLCTDLPSPFEIQYL